MYEHSMSIVILAAGKGMRMHSSLPKILHCLSGKPIIQYVIDTAKCLKARQIYLVYGYKGDLVKSSLSNNDNIQWILQKEQHGTGHALQQVISFLKEDDNILILYGDVPLISTQTLKDLYLVKPEGGIGLVTAIIDNPTGYGRIIRDNNGAVIRVVEEEDASEEQIDIHEVNTGILIANCSDMKRWLSKLDNNNAQKEFYISDIVSVAYHEGRTVKTIKPKLVYEIYGVNNRLQLSILERIYQKQQIENLLLSGVMLHDADRFDLRGKLKHGYDIEIDINVIIKGNVTLGNNVKIGVGCVIKNSVIADNCIISPYTIIENSNLFYSCTVGPFAHLRSNCILHENTHVGNFVEMKNTILGKYSKVGHLSYLGDAKIGSKVNIGAGTITCNFDGANKFKTIIGDNVFVGSDTQLIAPIKIVNGATIAAGTTLMKDVNTSDLIYNKKEQNNKSGWIRSVKK